MTFTTISHRIGGGRLLMKACGKNFGFTLIEIIMTVAIIVILVSMVVGITKRIDDQNRERLCRNELALIDNALEQFRDFGFEYKDTSFAGLSFPLDFTGFNELTFEGKLQIALYSSTTVDIQPNGANDPCYSGSEALYFILSQVPECRTTLDKIDKSLITNDINAVSLNITISSVATSQTLPFRRFIDPWKTTLRYDYYDESSFPPDPATKKTFPVITSAGADRKFGTNDDIVNRQGK